LPKEPIASKEELEHEIESIGLRIKDLVTDWKIRRVALLELQHLTKNRNALSFENVSILVGNHVIPGICTQVSHEMLL
jgi:hypothetical protein